MSNVTTNVSSGGEAFVSDLIVGKVNAKEPSLAEPVHCFDDLSLWKFRIVTGADCTVDLGQRHWSSVDDQDVEDAERDGARRQFNRLSCRWIDDDSHAVSLSAEASCIESTSI